VPPVRAGGRDGTSSGSLERSTARQGPYVH
jgi:hypothetical protein